MLYGLFTALALVLLALDQWVKHWIILNLPLGERMPFWPGVVELRTVHNYGAAWSSFSGQRWFLLIITCTIVLAIVVLVAKKIVRHPLGLCGLALVVSGGIGNIIDRIRFGYVVDMFQFEFWQSYPVFNVADICVVVGAVVSVVYYMWFYEKYDMKKPAVETAAEEAKEEADGDSDTPSE